jgi:hypothetical protein
LVVALDFLQLRQDRLEVVPLRQWLDSWTGLGAVVDDMRSLGYDVALTRHGGTSLGWRALFYPSRFLHVSKAGDAWSPMPWRAVQDAAWMTLSREMRGEHCLRE